MLLCALACWQPKSLRQKTGRQGADALSSGASAPVVATAFDDIPKIMRQALTILDDVHELRHYSSETVHLEPKSLLKPVDGAFPWPICSGGTFKDIAQRAWADPERLIEMSACFRHKAGLVESADKEEFVQQFCKLDGETVTLRLPCAPLRPVNLAVGSLYFSDGSQKTLGAFLVWICLMLATQLPDFEDSDYENPSFLALVGSLLRIRSVQKSTVGAGDEIDNTIARIVKQNVDSKVQAVSSLTWASILASMGEGVSLDTLIARYNNHPEVKAFENQQATGSISLDGRKRQAVKNYLEKTAAPAFGVLLKSTHDICWALGPFGESFGSYTHMFLGSCANLESSQPNEDEMIVNMFERTTSMIAVPQKKRYRLSGDDLFRVRNMVCLFDQIYPHLGARIGLDAANKWLEDIRSGTHRDADLMSLLHMRPPIFAMSMLPSEQEQSKRSLEELEIKKCEDKESQKAEVTAAQWAFFKGALSRDQSKLDSVQQAPRNVRLRLHAKQVAHRSRLVAEGEESFLKVIALEKMDLLGSEISKYKSQIADAMQVGVDSIHCLGLCDYNAPGARQNTKAESLAQGMAMINSSGSLAKNSVICLLPDHPKDSSIRGLYDEERVIMEALFSQQQSVECRFIDLFTREKKSENKTNTRRFAAGRVVVHGDTLDSNFWLSSELAVCGRPVGRAEGEQGAPTSILPRASALLLPEAGSPDQDLKLAERTRPSPEQTSAQKGTARLELLIESAFRHTRITGPTILVNLTGYVEEAAAAVLNLRIKGKLAGDGGGYDFADLHYLSAHTLESKSGIAYAKTRVYRELLDAWLSKRIVFQGKRFDDTDIALTDKELAEIPHAQCIKSADALELEACVRQGTKIAIHPDQVKQWTSSGAALEAEFKKLEANHIEKYQNCLASVITAQAQSSSSLPTAAGAVVAADDENNEDDPPPASPAPVTQDSEFASLEKLRESDAVEVKCASEVAGVDLIKTASGKIWLLSEKDRVVPRFSQIGGYGTGKYVPTSEAGDGVALEWPEKDKTLVQVDQSSVTPESNQIQVMSLYRFLVQLERTKKLSVYQLSYSECTRKPTNTASGNSDGFEITLKDAQKYKSLAGADRTVTAKSFFAAIMAKVDQSAFIGKIFRWRFERVHAVCKVQKPYVILRSALQLKAGRPFQIA
ncbi:unnamed protein product [Durusdinium trenchii]|uniref:Uncharacterized protein n=1 Tax=Durusdinium trenchii TaxID=1381693 RepID=A0ABP0MPH1_9DINO